MALSSQCEKSRSLFSRRDLADPFSADLSGATDDRSGVTADPFNPLKANAFCGRTFCNPHATNSRGANSDCSAGRICEGGALADRQQECNGSAPAFPLQGA